MEIVETINTIAQLGGTALAIAVLIYVLAFFRGEVKSNKEDLAKFVEKTLQTQKEMQTQFLETLSEERKNIASQEEYIRELTKDMITVLNTNNGHLQNLVSTTESSRQDVENNVKKVLEENQKELNKKLLIIAQGLELDPKDFLS